MAKKYDDYQYNDFNYQEYASKRQPQLDQLYNQYSNFNNTYDPSKDTALQTAKNQLMSEANVLASKERGRMGNRIGARSSWEDAISSSVQTDALKNYQNLIPQYMQNAKSDLLNQYNMLNQMEQRDYGRWSDNRNFNYQKYSDDRGFDYQNYANAIAQEQADRAYNYQLEQDKKANEIAMEQAKAAQIKAQADADKQAWEQRYKYDQLRAEYGSETVPYVDSQGNRISPTAAGTAFRKLIWPKAQFDSSPSVKEKYGSYNNYVKRMIQQEHKKENLSTDDVNYLNAYYGFY